MKDIYSRFSLKFLHKLNMNEEEQGGVMLLNRIPKDLAFLQIPLLVTQAHAKERAQNEEEREEEKKIFYNDVERIKRKIVKMNT